MSYKQGFFLTVCVALCFFSLSPIAAQSEAREDRSVQLPIPPVLEGKKIKPDSVLYELDVHQGETQFFPGISSETLGYNGNILGPTIRVRRGENIRFRIKNNLDEETTVHWHGAHIPAEMDGGPRQRIAPGKVWEPYFTVNQAAATLWYHPHLMGETASQVYKGLAGLLIIDDEISDKLEIPNKYGINDIPLIVQERRFISGGRLAFAPAMHDIIHGYNGNAILVNGAFHPDFEVTESLIRFRILNGSNSSVMAFYFENDKPFFQIASDGGFLESPVEMSRLILSPGERAEVLVDFSGEDTDIIELKALKSDGMEFEFLTLDLSNLASKEEIITTIPENIVNLDDPDLSGSTRDRRFFLSTMGMGGALTINGERMDLSRIDEKVILGSKEIWEIRNTGGGMGRRRMMGMMNVTHNFHVHGLQFRIIDINGKTPPPNERGLKDTVLLFPGDRIRILVEFKNYTGVYMYHCHLLEHEDAGMMGQFEVIPGIVSQIDAGP